MRKSTATVRDVIDELVTPDEQLFSEMQRLADQGAADSMTPALIVRSVCLGALISAPHARQPRLLLTRQSGWPIVVLEFHEPGI